MPKMATKPPTSFYHDPQYIGYYNPPTVGLTCFVCYVHQFFRDFPGCTKPNFMDVPQSYKILGFSGVVLGHGVLILPWVVHRNQRRVHMGFKGFTVDAPSIIHGGNL